MGGHAERIVVEEGAPEADSALPWPKVFELAKEFCDSVADRVRNWVILAIAPLAFADAVAMQLGPPPVSSRPGYSPVCARLTGIHADLTGEVVLLGLAKALGISSDQLRLLAVSSSLAFCEPMLLDQISTAGWNAPTGGGEVASTSPNFREPRRRLDFAIVPVEN